MNHPRTIKELVNEAHNYEYSTSVPLKVYLRTAETLSRHVCFGVNGLYMNYLLIYRLICTLHRMHLVMHIYYIYGFLSELKKQIVKERETNNSSLLTNKISKNPQLKKGTDHYKSYSHLLSKKAPTAIRNAESIKKKLDEEITAYERYLKLRQSQQEKEKAANQPKEPEIVKEQTPDHDDFDEEKFTKRLRQFQNQQNQGISSNLDLTSYPKIEHSLSPINSTSPTPALIPPSLPPKTALSDSIQPSLPPKTALNKPQHKSIATTEGKIPLKTIFLPSQLPLSFLSLSSQNSSANLETCGILCGSLSLGAFFITTLLIPSQISTANTCQTTHEEDIFSYVDSKDLFVLGWIHTHPTQSCFLSSVDLHTQNGYQIMLPEALAIVCAVKHGIMGQFRLTDPPGVGIITKCQKSGFHPHEEAELYKHCESKLGGHVVVKDGLPFEIVDLRKKD